jgi:hypothetical protein
MTTPTTLDERLEDARANEAREEEAQIQRDKERELLILDLKAKFRAEFGTLGKDFDVVEFPVLDLVVALKRAEPIVVKRFNEQNRGRRDATLEEIQQYVVPSVVYPERGEFKKWTAAHGQIVTECALKLRVMEGLRLEEKAGKP